MSVPKPKQLADGRWVGQLMVDGKRYSVYGHTKEEYEINARATKAGLIEARSERPKLALGDIIDRYIESNEHVLSPSTIRGYKTIRKHRFAGWMEQDIQSINWQAMVNEESLGSSAKTVKNAWGLVSASLAASEEKVPSVHLPKPAKNELPFLNYIEIQAFLEAIHGKPSELAAILALHSLRESELFALNIGNQGFPGFKRLERIRPLKPLPELVQIAVQRFQRFYCGLLRNYYGFIFRFRKRRFPARQCIHWSRGFHRLHGRKS